MQAFTNVIVSNTKGDLSSAQRIARALVALTMLAYPMLTAAAPLGLVALLPLFAIYPMFTAVVGWDPVRYTINNSDETLGMRQTVARAGLVVVGTGLIGAAMLTTVHPIGGIAVLALLGVVPVFIAIFGENPLVALIQSSRNITEKPENSDQNQPSDNRRIVEYVSKASGSIADHEHLPEHDEAA